MVLVVSDPQRPGHSSSIKILHSFYVEKGLTQEVLQIWESIMHDRPPSLALFAFVLSSANDFYHSLARSKKQEVYRWEMGCRH